MNKNKVLSEFIKLYNDEIAPKLKSYRDNDCNRYEEFVKSEKEWCKNSQTNPVLGFFLIILIFFGPIVLLYAHVAINNFRLENIVFAIVLAIVTYSMYIGIIYYSNNFKLLYKFKRQREFVKYIKKNIIPIILTLFGKFKFINSYIELYEALVSGSKSYDANRSPIDITTIKKYGLYPTAYRKQDEDIIIGTYKNKSVIIVEANIVDDKNNNCFRGLIVKTKLNKRYNGRTVISSDKNFKFKSILKFEKIQLEDIEINKNFKIYSNDQTEVRYLLDLTFMEKIKTAEKIFNSSGINFLIKNDLFYMFINSRKNFFEVPLYEKCNDIEATKHICLEFIQIFNLIDYFESKKQT